jgi:glycosyltransferase involved in cell wall biosynthesis
MKRKHKALFITIVPSPYQRDLFGALAARDDVDLSVHYMEATSPDSPWPRQHLRAYERVMPGFWLPLGGGGRAHVNWSLPAIDDPHLNVVLSSFTSATAQWLMRYRLRARHWAFWGERLKKNSGVTELVQSRLAAPLASASAIVGIGRQAEAEYKERFPKPRHFCIPYHCDLSPFFAIDRRGRPIGPTTFLFCGQMIRRKGVDLLLAAFQGLVENGLDVRLLLVGREAELPAFLDRLSPAAHARVRYGGFLAPEALAEFFAQGDVFVLPSRHDGWGVVVNQALAAGLAVITSDAVGAGIDLVEHGRNGFRVPAGDVNNLQHAMATLALSQELCRQFGMASRRKARDLTPEEGAAKWVQVFEALEEHTARRLESTALDRRI